MASSGITMVAVEALMISGETSPRSSPLTSLYGGCGIAAEKGLLLTEHHSQESMRLSTATYWLCPRSQNSNSNRYRVLDVACCQTCVVQNTDFWPPPRILRLKAL